MYKGRDSFCCLADGLYGCCVLRHGFGVHAYGAKYLKRDKGKGEKYRSDAMLVSKEMGKNLRHRGKRSNYF